MTPSNVWLRMHKRPYARWAETSGQVTPDSSGQARVTGAHDFVVVLHPQSCLPRSPLLPHDTKRPAQQNTPRQPLVTHITEPALALETIPKEEVNVHGERLICFKSTIGTQGSVFLLMYCISDHCFFA